MMEIDLTRLYRKIVQKYDHDNYFKKLASNQSA